MNCKTDAVAKKAGTVLQPIDITLAIVCAPCATFSDAVWLILNTTCYAFARRIPAVVLILYSTVLLTFFIRLCCAHAGVFTKFEGGVWLI